MALADRPYGPAPSNPSGLSSNALNFQAAQEQGVLPATLEVVSSTEAKVMNPLQPTLALSVAIPPNTNLEQTPFDVYASGYIETTASGTIALGLYADGSASVVSGDLLHKTASATTQNSAKAPFALHAKLQYDSVSGKLTGVCGMNINNTVDPEIALANVITGIDNTNDPVLTLSLSLTSSGATANTPTTLVVNKFTAG